MMYKYFLLLTLFFTGCSLQEPKNAWQYKSTNAFNSYTINFLSANNMLAKSDLKRAIEHAKKSADFHQLATIYIGVSALHQSVGIEDKCIDYQNINDIIFDVSLQAYYHFLTHTLSREEIKLLPQQYQKFASYIQTKEFSKAQKEVKKMQKITSKLISAAIIKEHLNNETRDYLLKQASFYGYKKAVLFWLHQLVIYTKNEKKLKLLKKKILILQEGML